MTGHGIYRFGLAIITGIFIITSTGCANTPNITDDVLPSATVAPAASEAPSVATAEATPKEAPVSDPGALLKDDFTDPSTNWPEDKFDNYFIGYHEPEYYHIEITGENYRTTVFDPQKTSFDDATVDLQVMTASAKTAPTGDFRYGLAFRRSGDQYYAFTISPRTKQWFVLKSSPNGLTVLTEGTDDDIHDLDTDDDLRVDMQGSKFTLHINDQLVGQVSDPDYAAGAVGFYVESFDSPSTHIHFDTLIVRDLDVAPAEETGDLLYEDNFTNPASSWPERKFDNYFIGYHEPEYYHIELSGPNYKTTVFEPQKRTFDDATVEVKAFTASTKTSPTGDFRFGITFRRSGDQYYAFTISPRTKKWYVLKNSPNKLEVLSEGTEESLHDADTEDDLRVDIQGSSFIFHINGNLVGEVSDSDYASGEVGFYVESFDSPNTHIHFDHLSVRTVQVSVICDVSALTLNVRTGPGKSNPSSAILKSGETIEPVGRSEDNQWVKVKFNGGKEEGWVFNSSQYLTCRPSIDLVPVINP